MIQIPAPLLLQYKTFITHKGVPLKQLQYFIKWLRFFLDFCHKYTFIADTKTSLSAFMEKLREKKQSEKQIQQVRYALTLYFELISRAKKKVPPVTHRDKVYKSINPPLLKNKKYIKKTDR